MDQAVGPPCCKLAVAGSPLTPRSPSSDTGGSGGGAQSGGGRSAQTSRLSPSLEGAGPAARQGRGTAQTTPPSVDERAPPAQPAHGEGLGVATRGARSPARPRHARAARPAPGIRRLHLRAVPAVHAAAGGAEAGVGGGAPRPVSASARGGGWDGAQRLGGDARGAPWRFSLHPGCLPAPAISATVALLPQPTFPHQPILIGAARTSGYEAMIRSVLFLSDSAPHDSRASHEAVDLLGGFPSCGILLSKCMKCAWRVAALPRGLAGVRVAGQLFSVTIVFHWS